MSDPLAVVTLGLRHGLAMSVALSALIAASLRYDAEMWLNDYPPDIRERFGPMGAAARRRRIPVALTFLVILVGSVAYGLRELAALDVLGPASAFLYVAVLATTFNLIDLVLLDWLFFVRLQPRWIVLPGTEGAEGYRDYGFHFRAFLIGVAGTVVVAGIVAGGVALWRQA